MNNNMNRLAASVMAVGVLAGCGPSPASPEGAPEPDVSAAQDGEIKPVTLDEALEVSATDRSSFFIDGLGCGFKGSREEMGEWLEANIKDLKDQGHEGDAVLRELTERGRFEFLEFFKQNPERAKETLLGLVGTDRNDVSRGFTELGEWNIEDEASVLETIENLLTRSSIAIAHETMTVGNHACVGPDGEVVPAGTRTIREGDFVWVFEAEVEKDSETGEQELVMPDRTDPDESHSVTVEEEGAVIMSTSLGIRLVWSMVICGNQVGEENISEILITTTSSPKPTPSETTTTPPGEDNDKDDSKTSRRSRAVEEDEDAGETAEPGQEDEAEPGGADDLNGADETGHVDSNQPSGQDTVVDDNEGGAKNGGETTPASPPPDAERDDSTQEVNNENEKPGVEAEKPMEQPS